MSLSFIFLSMSKTILNFSSDMGYWCDEWEDMSRNTGFSVSVLLGEIGKDKDNILPISKNDYVPQNGDRVFFLPGVNVPRIKFKNLCDETGIRTVRDASKANVFVANNNTLNKLVYTHWAFKVKTDDFKALIAMEEFINKVDAQHYQKLEDALEFYTDSHVFVDRPTTRLIMSYVYKAQREPKQEQITSVLSEFRSLVDSANSAIIYDESTIIDQLNGDDAAVIDHAVYEQLNLMLESKDNDNTVLAMEIMANCKYSASLVHLMLLFYHQGNIFYSAPTKNHVNFKSLLSWLNLKPGDPSLTADEAIQLLREKGQLVPDKLNLLLSYIGNDIVHKGDTNVFKMKHITLAPELLAEMGVNYSYQMQEEFNVPEVQEGPEEEGHIVEEPIEAVTEEVNLESISGSETNKEHLDEIKQGEDSVEEIVIEDTEISLTPEPVSNNDQITQTNESDFEWF